MNALKNRKEFKITEGLTAVCHWQNTSYGFRHLATLYKDGYKEVATAKATYYNRTWESFEYQTVLRDLLNKYDGLSQEKKDQFLKNAETVEIENVNKQFGMLGAIMKMGEILTDNKKESNDWKARMMKAGLGEGITMPDNWNELSEDEKEMRLNKVIELNISK